VPFDPVPETIAELCRAAPVSWRAVELGCGDGVLLRRLRALGIWCAGLDSAPPQLAAGVSVRGDARWPPLRPSSLDLLLAPNLVRHLMAADPRCGFLESWLDLLRPGGSLFVIEDEPTPGAAAANYRELQAFLARLAPDRRGPLISLDAFRRALPAALAARVADCGTAPNRWPLDVAAVLAMLAGGRPRPAGEAARLAAAIRRHGLSCGRLWWARLNGD